MPELPEVETTRRGLKPLVINQTIQQIDIHQRQLRWPIPDTIKSLENQHIQQLTRRGKYLLARLSKGQHILFHLGMSGSMRVVPSTQTRKKHDHVEFHFYHGQTLRFHDPRRFGSILIAGYSPEKHNLLASLGPEPLDESFNGEWLKKTAGQRKVAVKNFIMNARVVVGVGNIYASEALFKAGIHPKRAASRISLHRYKQLANAIKVVLSDAIKSGGTTLKDFSNSQGKPGYFQQKLMVYGRPGAPCFECQRPISQATIGQRSSFYCLDCQH